MSTFSFMQGVDQSTVGLLVSAFLRGFSANKDIAAPKDIIGVVLTYFNPIMYWKLAIPEITSRLNTDFTTISGPEFIINGYKFVLKLKRSRNNLYFGPWYQRNNVIQRALHSHFQSSFNTQIADKIVESFDFINTDEEFDDVQLILHDMSDPTYSCILEHIENELRSSLLLIAYGNINTSVNNIKQNIIRILSDYNPGSGAKAVSFMFRVRLYCHENQMEYRKLYKFDTNQICEKGAEMYWRNKYNNFKDHRLDFEEFIKDKENLTFDCYMELINDTEQDRDDRKEQELSYNVSLDEQLKNKLINMKHGDHVYLYQNLGKYERFAIFIGCYYGQYNVFLQQLYPNKHNTDNLMVTNIGSVTLKVDEIEYGKAANLKFNEEDDIVLIGKFGTSIWVTKDDEQHQHQSPVLKVTLERIE